MDLKKNQHFQQLCIMGQTTTSNHGIRTSKRSETFSCWTPICQDYRWNIISSDPLAKLNSSKLGPALEKYIQEPLLQKAYLQN